MCIRAAAFAVCGPRGSSSRIPIVPNAKQCKIRKIPREKSTFRTKYVIFAQEPTRNAMRIRFTTDKNSVLRIDYQSLPTRFGEMLTAWTDAGELCFAAFTTYRGRERVMRELTTLFPAAALHEVSDRSSIFDEKPTAILLAGTQFRHDVWRALLEIPCGETVTYARLAELAGHPRAVRATGTAVGSNPICCIVPCHRIVPAAGGTGNYHGGAEIKKALLAEEGAQIK